MALGASAPRAGQRPAEWLAQALEAVGASTLRHGGNYRYVWVIGDRRQRRRTRIALAPQPYPKSVDDECQPPSR